MNVPRHLLVDHLRPCAFQSPPRIQSRRNALLDSCARLALMAMRVMLPAMGVALPAAAQADTSLPGSGGTLYLQNYGSSGTSFVINAGTSVGGIYGSAAYPSWTVTNLGTVSGADAASGFGVDLEGTTSNIFNNYGTVTKSNSPTGYNDGVYVRYGQATIYNAGKIVGGSATNFSQIGSGVQLAAGGSVTNANTGTIAGYEAGGIAVSNIPGTIINAGNITGDPGVRFLNSGNNTLVNSGTITGSNGAPAVMFGDGNNLLELLPGAKFVGVVEGGNGSNTLEFGGTAQGSFTGLGTASFTNFDTVEVDSGAYWQFTGGNTIASGVTFTNSGSLTVTGTLLDAGSLTNSGAISGGVTLSGSGKLQNEGMITGTQYAVQGQTYAASILTNTGTITGTGTGFHNSGVHLSPGAFVTNSGTSSVISGHYGVYLSGGNTGNPSTVVNEGKISGSNTASGIGVYVDQYPQKIVINAGTAAVISGGKFGIYFIEGRTSLNDIITNDGIISGNIAAISAVFSNSVNITNNNFGTIKNGIQLVLDSGTSTSTIANFGVIYGSSAIYSSSTNLDITNNSGASITSVGGRFGIYLYSSNTTITNDGLISGGSVAAIYAKGNGTVGITNTGMISGVIGVDLVNDSQNSTIVNAGTITGTGGTAVQFGSGNNVLVLQPGAVFNGVIDGGGGSNTLELAGTTQGSFAGLGTSFTGFGRVQVDSGAYWKFTGTNTVASGGTLTNAGTMAVTGNLLNDGALLDTGTLSNAGAISGGVTLSGSGVLTNSGAVTNSGSDGIDASGSSTVINSGTGSTISGASIGIKFDISGSGNADLISNDGIISGGSTGIRIQTSLPANSGSMTITNAGTIRETGLGFTTGIFLSDTGISNTIVNSNLIAGGGGGIFVGPNYSATGMTMITNNNTGMISSRYSYAIYIRNTKAIITNAGTLDGSSFGVEFGSGAGDSTIVNSGAIIGNGGMAVQFGDGNDLLELLPGATFTGGVDGGGGSNKLELAAGTGTANLTGLGTSFTNFDTVQVDSGANWQFTGGNTITSDVAFTNSGTIVSTGTFVDAGTLTNAGSIAGTVTLSNTGVLINQAGKTVSNGSGRNGVYGQGAGVAVNNYGTIRSTSGTGIYLHDGGSLANHAGATIMGANGGSSGINGAGVYISRGAGTVTNDGTIQAGYGSVGVDLANGGTVDNHAGATIYGGAAGVAIAGSAGTVTNSGTITGADGIDLSRSVNGNTVVNAGAIIGNAGTAVQFGGGDDLLELLPGAAFTGAVDGGGGSNMLELAAGAGTASLTGLGTSFTNFGTMQVDGGAYWQFTGSNTIASTVALTNAGTIDNLGTFLDAGTLINAGTILGGVTLTGGMLHNELFIAGIDVASGGTITNDAGALISNAGYGVRVDGGVAHIVNRGSIVGSGVSGVGVLFASTGSGTVDNYGVISGASGTAVKFAGGTNMLIIENGGTLTGEADGSLGTNTLVVRSGAVLSGVQAVGFQYVGFYDATSPVDGGSTITNPTVLSGTLTNNGTLNGILTVDSGATLSNTGTVSVDAASTSSGVIVNSGPFTNNSTLTNAGYFSNGTALTNLGVLVDSGTLANFGTLTSDAGNLVVSGSLANSGIIAGTVTLSGTGLLTNDIGASITGGIGIADVSGATATVNNAGTITGTTGAGIDLASGSHVSNTGVITGASYGVRLTGVGGTVSNDGTINGGTGGIAVQFGGSGNLLQVTANAVFGGSLNDSTGANALEFLAGTGAMPSFSNFGTVTVDAGGAWTVAGARDAATLANNGTLTNTGSLTVTASLIDAGILINQSTIAGAVTVANGGVLNNPAHATITAANGTGVTLASGGGFTNAGMISGGNAGMEVTGTNVMITNASTGTIEASSAAGIGILFSGGGSGTIDNFGTIIGGSAGAAIRFAGNANELIVENGGVLEGLIDGNNGANTLVIKDGGSLDAAQIIGFQSTAFTGTTTADAGTSVDNAVIGDGSTPTVLNNAGTLSRALMVMAGGTVSNTGSITLTAGSSNDGTIASTGAGTFTNAANFTNDGTVTSDTVGVIDNGGTIINNAGALIQGANYGVVIGTGGTVTNAGTILDDAIAGASLGSSASLSNLAGGLVSGVVGVVFTGTNASLVNAGTITGSGGVAVQFDTGSNRLTLDTGSVLNGRIEGGGGAGQINLAGTGTLANTIANFGTGSALTIASGANWSGSGAWTIASVVNSGSFQVGTNGTPLTLTGNFTQSTGGTLKAVLTAGSTMAPLQITGSATLAGNLAIGASGSPFAAGTRYTVLNATGGVSGTFAQASFDAALLSPSLSYDADDVFVTLAQNAVTTAASTPNQVATASAFDQGNAANPSSFAAALSALDLLDRQGVQAAINRLSGESNADLGTMALMAGQQFLGQIHDQQALAREGGPGAPRQYASLSGGPSENPDANILKPWSIWGSGFGQTGQIAGDGNTHRLTETLAGATVGADYKLSPPLKLGGAVGYAHSTFSLENGGGHGGSNDGLFALYGEYRSGAAYVDGAVGAAIGTGSTHREIGLPSGTAHGNTSDTQALGSVEAGYGFKLGKTALTPFAGIDWGVDNQQGFTENGAGVLDLNVHRQSQTSVRSRLGTRISGELPLGRLRIATSVTFGWTHELAGTGRTVTSAFVGAPGASFTVSGTPVPQDTALVGVGFSTAIGRGASLYLDYDGQMAPESDSHAVTGGFRYSW